VSGIALFTENLEAFSAERARVLDHKLKALVGVGIEAVYALVWPNYPPEVPRPQRNREIFGDWRAASGVPLWCWLNTSADQAADVDTIHLLDEQLLPTGWLLDIEGSWVNGARLTALADGTAALGKPRRASLAGASASHVVPDYRALDNAGFEVDWQAYFDSGEGPVPQVALRELYQSSFVVEGWEYRHHIGGAYG